MDGEEGLDGQDLGRDAFEYSDKRKRDIDHDGIDANGDEYGNLVYSYLTTLFFSFSPPPPIFFNDRFVSPAFFLFCFILSPFLNLFNH